jgi:hypothetical protein
LNENIDSKYSEADGHDDDTEVAVGRHGDSVAAMGKINKHSPAADWREHVTINGKEIQLKLDTGAQCNVMSLNLCEAMNLTIEKCPTKSLISYSEHRIPVIGQVTNCSQRCPSTFDFQNSSRKVPTNTGKSKLRVQKLNQPCPANKR